MEFENVVEDIDNNWIRSQNNVFEGNEERIRDSAS